MKVLVVADGHYYKDKLGDYYVDSVFDYSFYSRYLSVFDEVYAIVRTEDVNVAPVYAKKSSGEKVHFLPIKNTVGVKQYVLNLIDSKKKIRKYIKDFDRAVFRVPGVTANEVYNLWNKKKPYALEVVVDPWEYFAPGTIKGLARPLVRVLWTLALKEMCRKSHAVSYVTEKYLQVKYPCKALRGAPGYITGSYSSVDLPDEKFGKPRVFKEQKQWIISHVAASFATYGKGHITLMNTLRCLVDNNIDAKVIFVGDGPLRVEFEKYAHSIGIEDKVLFTGMLPNGDAVHDVLKKSDLFVFPTKAEGLPRVVLEAMSEGLPVISSPVCGIPELLEKKYLVPYDDYMGYFEAIMSLIDNPDAMTSASVHNIKTALGYRKSILMTRRKNFLTQLSEYRCGNN